MFREYKIYSDNRIAGLELSVNGAIRDGWQPVGGVSVVQTRLDANHAVAEVGDIALLYVQAVAR